MIAHDDGVRGAAVLSEGLVPASEGGGGRRGPGTTTTKDCYCSWSTGRATVRRRATTINRGERTPTFPESVLPRTSAVGVIPGQLEPVGPGPSSH